MRDVENGVHGLSDHVGANKEKGADSVVQVCKREGKERDWSNGAKIYFKNGVGKRGQGRDGLERTIAHVFYSSLTIVYTEKT